MRIASAVLLIACLAACKSGSQSNDAVRQGVVDYLQKSGFNMAAMDVTIANVKFDGSQKADAKVNIGVKGSGTTAMSMDYHLEMKDNKWTVVGKMDSGQHGALAPPPPDGAPAGAAGNPHAGGAPGAPAGGGKMPSPEDLPPAGKKK